MFLPLLEICHFCPFQKIQPVVQLTHDHLHTHALASLNTPFSISLPASSAKGSTVYTSTLLANSTGGCRCQTSVWKSHSWWSWWHNFQVWGQVGDVFPVHKLTYIKGTNTTSQNNSLKQTTNIQISIYIFCHLPLQLKPRTLCWEDQSHHHSAPQISIRCSGF